MLQLPSFVNLDTASSILFIGTTRKLLQKNSSKNNKNIGKKKKWIFLNFCIVFLLFFFLLVLSHFILQLIYILLVVAFSSSDESEFETVVQKLISNTSPFQISFFEECISSLRQIVARCLWQLIVVDNKLFEYLSVSLF